MPCPDEDALFGLVGRRLAPERAAVIVAHADECVACQTALGEVARLVMGGSRPDARSRVPPLVAGEIVTGRFKLLQLLGEGGAGVVWSALRTDDDTPVAIKFLRFDHARHVRRLAREARLARSLNHPNLVPVHELLVLRGRPPALVMELLYGESLAERISRGPFDVDRAASLGATLCDCTAALHAVAIFHRDLKPSNVFLVRDAQRGEWPRVLDLGMAKQLGDSTRPTTLGTLLGTPRYMAPEQLFGTEECDERVDVWALGAILYEMLAGEPHVRAHRPVHVMRAIVAGIRPLRELVPVPATIDSLVMHMLSTDARERPTAVQAAAALRA